MRDKKICIIAEAGDNHNGNLGMAKQLIDEAKLAGADIVKFQTFSSAEVVSRFAAKAEYQKTTTDQSENQLEMIKKLELTAADHRELVKYCKIKGVRFLSTPFDLPSLDLLVNDLKVDMIKIPSGEIISGPLLLKAAQTGLPIILSTGMSTLGDIEAALGVLAFGYLQLSECLSKEAFAKAYCSSAGQQVLKEKVTLLHCTTEYPAPFEDVNLNAMKTLSQAFGLPVGLSDHTSGISVSLAATALGVTVIEKHFTLDKNLPGPDHQASLEPDELRNLVREVRNIEQALGDGVKFPQPSEQKNMDIARKSLVARAHIKQGEVFTLDNLAFKRPGTGISPMEYWDFIGKEAQHEYQEDELIRWG